MRRWNSFFLVPLVAVVLAAVVSSTPAGANARSSPSTSMNFKGKIVAKNSDTHYFVLSFTCSPSPSGTTGSLSAGWTYEVDSTHSFTGTLDTAHPPSCTLSSTNGAATWFQPSVELFCVTCVPNPNPMVGTLTVDLTGIVATKTFFNIPTPTAICSSSTVPQLCLDVETSTPLSGSLSGVAGFSSQCANFTCPSGFPYATLNLSAR